MNNYLITLFKDENTVILPGLGALTVVNRATNELMFMSFLKHNDGTLVKYVAQQEGINADLAKERVEKYVEEIHSVLNNGGVFEMNQIGSFSKDASGEIQFIQPVPGVPAVEKFEQIIEEPVKEIAAEVEQEIASPVEETEQVVEDITPAPVDLIEESAVTEEPEEIQPVIEESEDAIVETEAEIPVVEEFIEELETKTEPTVTASEEDQWNDDLDLPPLNYKAERPKKPILEKTKKDKKPRKTGTLLVLLLAVIIFGGATYVGMNYSDLKEKIPFLASKSEKLEEEVELEEETVELEEIEDESELIDETSEEIEDSEPIQEIAPESEPVQKVVEKSTPVVSSTGLRLDKSLPIQIIVGSFGEESNATRFVEKLKAQGFPAGVIGVYGGLHTVSVASFSSMDEYNANSSHLKSAGAYWIKK